MRTYIYFIGVFGLAIKNGWHSYYDNVTSKFLCILFWWLGYFSFAFFSTAERFFKHSMEGLIKMRNEEWGKKMSMQRVVAVDSTWRRQSPTELFNYQDSWRFRSPQIRWYTCYMHAPTLCQSCWMSTFRPWPSRTFLFFEPFEVHLRLQLYLTSGCLDGVSHTSRVLS